MTSSTLSSRFFVCTAIGLFALLGCKDSAKKQDAGVQGTVVVDGELAAQGIVAFHPDDGGAVAYGTIHSDGSYALRIGRGQRNDLDNSKIYSGKYTATVAVTSSTPDMEESKGNLRDPSPRLTDAKFSDKTTSELKYEVTPGRNIINISVERAQLDDIEEVGSQGTAAAEEGQVLADEQESGDDGIAEEEREVGEEASANEEREETEE